MHCHRCQPEGPRARGNPQEGMISVILELAEVTEAHVLLERTVMCPQLTGREAGKSRLAGAKKVGVESAARGL